jgi:hypothetical protein
MGYDEDPAGLFCNGLFQIFPSIVGISDLILLTQEEAVDEDLREMMELHSRTPQMTPASFLGEQGPVKPDTDDNPGR